MTGRSHRLAARLFPRDPRFFDYLRARYQSWSIILTEILNQSYRLAHLPGACQLTTVGVETNNTCNLSCLHCPVNQGMKRKKGLMKLETFQKIIDLNPEVDRVYLTDWGEPLLHPQLVSMINYAHEQGKHTSLTTNATLLDEILSQALLDSHLDVIKFSVDGGQEIYQKIRGFSYEQVEANILRFIRMRNESKKKTWIEVSMVIYDETLPEVEAFQKEWRGKADFVNFQPKFFSLPKRKKSLCRDLWRILVVLWDGRVVPCCVDYEGDIILGDAEKEDLQKIFQGPKMKALRKKHFQNKLPGLCAKCLPYYADYHLPPRLLRS